MSNELEEMKEKSRVSFESSTSGRTVEKHIGILASFVDLQQKIEPGTSRLRNNSANCLDTVFNKSDAYILIDFVLGYLMPLLQL
jgi:hypothetical protein